MPLASKTATCAGRFPSLIYCLSLFLLLGKSLNVDVHGVPNQGRCRGTSEVLTAYIRLKRKSGRLFLGRDIDAELVQFRRKGHGMGLTE